MEPQALVPSDMGFDLRLATSLKWTALVRSNQAKA